MMKRKEYVKPQVAVILLEVERGYMLIGTIGKTDDKDRPSIGPIRPDEAGAPRGWFEEEEEEEYREGW